ncbi:hypothetical protein BJI55_15890 [Acinetobacter pittii]|nr:hypothetical protein BJI55_15890 [Acinetobacter pittii]
MALKQKNGLKISVIIIGKTSNFNKIREEEIYQFTGTDAIRFEAVELPVAWSHKKLISHF